MWMCLWECDCEGVGVIVYVGVGVIAWVSKGVCWQGSLDFCEKVGASVTA